MALRIGDEPSSDPIAVNVRLSDRELDVLRLIAQGHDRAGIAAVLNYSEMTVKNTVARIVSKLGAETQAQAVHEGWRHGLLGNQPVNESTQRLIDAMRAHMARLEQEVADLRTRNTRALQALMEQS